MGLARDWIAVGMLAFAGLAMASTADVRKQVEASMVVTGTIDIEPDGSVADYEINRPGQVPDYVLEHIGRQVPGWRFEPVEVEGRPMPVRSAMSIRMQALQDGDNVLVSIGSAYFHNPDRAARGSSSRQRRAPPQYPADMLHAGVQGDVYMVLKIGPDGKVEEAVVEQVNLHAVGTARQMASARRAFSDASLRVARRWTFEPFDNFDASGNHRDVRRVPIEFRINGMYQPGYGDWAGYVPGPRSRPDWIDGKDAGNDALAAGGVYPVGEGRRLLTALGPGEG